MRSDLFDCLPQSAALLLLWSILQLTDAHAVQRLPRKTPEPTITVPYRALNVAPWPLHATPPPGGDTFANRRRQLDDTFNTVCGYINGDQNLPATCGQGSHCVVDTDHNVVGCCPNGAPSCTAGVFTGCVDGNSGPQTEVNPYIYSCTGSDVCYMNVYEGGFSQYGCGTASDLAATVQNSASGITAVLTRPTVSVSYTQGISTLSEPTTLGTPRSRTRSSTARTSHSSSATSASSTSSESTSSTSEPAAPPATDKSYRTGAIIGGTIGGLAVLIALGALAFFFLRRRNANIRQGPGLGGVRGKIISPPQPGKGTGFAALASDDANAFETGPAGSVLNQPYPQQQQQQQQPQMTMHVTAAPTAAAPTATAAAAAAAGAAASAPPTNRSLLPPIATSPPMPFQSEHHQPYQNPGPAAYAGGSGVLMGMNPLLLNRGAERSLESDQVPLTSGREVDDFSHGYHAALGMIGEEDEDGEEEQRRSRGYGGYQAPYRDHVGENAGEKAATGGTGSGDGARSVLRGEARPLWQQNRRQSRNLMWM
ncbi:hypothetical protein L209DRAFT_677214 [Thermothelomyces heterothallicus CBS 203.75]